MKQVHAIIIGHVQGVFFRKSTQEKAIELNITGWVKNQHDGNVEAIFQGKNENIKKILQWCNIGPKYATVNQINIISSKDCTKSYDHFTILNE